MNCLGYLVCQYNRDEDSDGFFDEIVRICERNNIRFDSYPQTSQFGQRKKIYLLFISRFTLDIWVWNEIIGISRKVFAAA